MKVDKGYNDVRLRELYPKLASAFESLLESNKELAVKFKYIYYSHYSTSGRSDKSLSLGRIISIVKENGYDVDITAEEIETLNTK